MTSEFRRAKLLKLCAIEGYDSEAELFEAAVADSVSPAICCNPDNPDCDYVEAKEPDSTVGWCEECGRGTMVSALVLGGLI
jgi:histidinol-phosphate/aromatic aminotransferase/cobyric acid decarboxylase-like protein